MVNAGATMQSAPEPVIKEWLAEYKSLPESSKSSYAEDILKKTDVSQALMKLFSSYSNDHDVIQPVCHQLFDFYRSGHSNLVHFTIDLIPSIVRNNIVSAYSGGTTTSTDTLLLSIYTISSDESSGSLELEIPHLGNHSIYHDPMSGTLSDQTLNIQGQGRRVYESPYLPNYQSIIPSNRYQILTQVLSVYLRNIALLRHQSIISLCNMCMFFGASGYPWHNKYLDENVNKRRYPLSVDFLMKMLRCLHYALFNKCYSEALKGLEAIDMRSKKDLIPQAMFMCNALMDSLEDYEGLNKDHDQNPYGLTSVNLTPLLTHETSRKGGRFAATAKSIKGHKWRHCSEEISGDLTRSLQNTDTNAGIAKPPQNHEDEIKADKYSTASPSKLLKTKLKKSTTEKSRSPAPSTGDKKAKKVAAEKISEEQDQDKIKRSPSQHKDVKYSSLQKHPSVDDASASQRSKSHISVSKSSSDVAKSSPSAKHRAMTKDDTSSSTALIDPSDSKNDSMSSDDKESLPLLPSSDSPPKTKNSMEQTAF